MAYLLKLNFKPKKWQLNRLYKTINKDTIITHDQYEKLNNKLSQLKNERKTVKKTIKNFYHLRDNYKTIACNRSIGNYKTRLAIEIILTIIQWKNNSAKERRAIEILAQSIAKNIMNVADLPSETCSSNSLLEEELKGFVTWHIAVSEALFLKITEQYGHLNLPLLKQDQPDQKAELMVALLNSSFSLDFSDADIDKILATVQNQILLRDNEINSII